MADTAARPSLAEVYIGKDPDDVASCAVWRVPPEGGRHECLAKGFRLRKDAERWLDLNCSKR